MSSTSARQSSHRHRDAGSWKEKQLMKGRRWFRIALVSCYVWQPHIRFCMFQENIIYRTFYPLNGCWGVKKSRLLCQWALLTSMIFGKTKVYRKLQFRLCSNDQNHFGFSSTSCPLLLCVSSSFHETNYNLHCNQAAQINRHQPNRSWSTNCRKNPEGKPSAWNSHD